MHRAQARRMVPPYAGNAAARPPALRRIALATGYASVASALLKVALGRIAAPTNAMSGW